MSTSIHFGGGSSKPIKIESVIDTYKTINFKTGLFKYADVFVFGARTAGNSANDNAQLSISTSSGINKSYRVYQNTYVKERLDVSTASSISIDASGSYYIKGRIVVILHSIED